MDLTYLVQCRWAWSVKLMDGEVFFSCPFALLPLVHGSIANCHNPNLTQSRLLGASWGNAQGCSTGSCSAIVVLHHCMLLHGALPLYSCHHNPLSHWVHSLIECTPYCGAVLKYTPSLYSANINDASWCCRWEPTTLTLLSLGYPTDLGVHLLCYLLRTLL